jgi:hypothetical protein
MKTQRKARIITWRDYTFDGDDYWITVHFYDKEEEYVTAKWKRGSDGKTGELGYGLGQCDAAIDEAKILIQKQRVEEKVAAPQI